MWITIKSISKDYLISKFPCIFNGISRIKDPLASIKLKTDSKPVFFNFWFRKSNWFKVKRLNKKAILKFVVYSEWCNPVEIVSKPDKNFRICDDYRITINDSDENDNYLYPWMEELFLKLTYTKIFTVIGLNGVFQQTADNETSKILTINTHKRSYNVV